MTSGVSSGCDLTHRLERDSTRSCQVTTSELRQSLKDSCGLSGCASMFTLLYTLTSTNAMRHIRLAFSLLVLLLASGVSLASQEPATVRGTVMDSVRRAPLVGATVVLLRTGPERSGESVTAKSGKRGEFTISVPAGRYGLTVEHPSLDSMESAVVPVALDLAAGEQREVSLATPSPATLKARACPGLALDSLTGALLGRVEDARSGGPVGGATLVVQWTDFETSPTSKGISRLTHTVETKSNEAGFFAACGIPLELSLSTQVHGENTQTGVIDLMISPRGVLTRVFAIDTAVGGAGIESLHTVIGSIAGPDGAPIPRARVRVSGDTLEAATDEGGHFRLRTNLAGTQTLEAVAIGYMPGNAIVDIVDTHEAMMNLRLEKFAVVLEAMRSVATRASSALAHKGFESQSTSKRGSYIPPDMLASYSVFRLSDMLRVLKGYHPPSSRGITSLGALSAPANAAQRQLRGLRPNVQAQPLGVGSSGCPEVYVDGFLDRSGKGLDAVPPHWVYGVEFHLVNEGSSGAISNNCGLILIWLK